MAIPGPPGARPRYHRADVVEHALGLLDRYGLADLSMRRLAGELGVQPSALYHHFASKQQLLAAVAEEILRRGDRPVTAGSWDEAATAVCTRLRDAMLAYRDGVEVVATVHAFGIGADGPELRLRELLAAGGLPAELTRIAARALMHFVLGSAADEQTHLQADSAGAIGDDPGRRDDLFPGGNTGGNDSLDDFGVGLDLLMDGIRNRLGQTTKR